MKKTPKIIVITGAESTGKSTLTEALAKHLHVPFIPEIAREYVEKLDSDYNYDDVVKIAQMQIEHFEKVQHSNSPYIFIDTWLLNTKVWFEEVFKRSPEWLIQKIVQIKIDLFLVCDIDLPWVYDPVRENGGDKRKLLHQKYIENINEFNYNYNIVSGQGEQRLQNALHYLNILK